MTVQDRYDHEHKYYMQPNTKKDFEIITSGEHVGLYELIEYAYFSCKCLDVVKVKVKHKEEVDESD